MAPDFAHGTLALHCITLLASTDRRWRRLLTL